MGAGAACEGGGEMRVRALVQPTCGELSDPPGVIPSISLMPSMPGRSASRALTSPPLWHIGAGPDPDPTPQVPSENPHQVYRNPEHPILRTLDFRELPDLAGAGPGGSEFVKGTTRSDSERPFLLQCPLSWGRIKVCNLDFLEGLSPLLNHIWLLGGRLQLPRMHRGWESRWASSGYMDRSEGFRQGDPLRVPLKPFVGYMPCGPQGLLSDKTSSNTTHLTTH